MVIWDPFWFGAFERKLFSWAETRVFDVRLAWHASGTFCQKTQTGGSDGATMRFYTEAADDANAGLDKAR